MSESRPTSLLSRIWSSPGTPSLLLAIALAFLWQGVFAWLHPLPFGDEYDHQYAIFQIAAGDLELQGLPMLPGYHVLVAAFGSLVPPSLEFSRLLSTFFFVGTLLLVASTPRPGSRRLASPLPIALLPILFPYTALAYTDTASLFFVIAAVWTRGRGLHALSACAAFLACLMRQSNGLWVLFLIAWNVLEAQREGQSSVREFLRRNIGHLLVLLLLALLLVWGGGLLVDDIPENRPRPNLGQAYLLSFLVLVLWAPIWWSLTREASTTLWSGTRPASWARPAARTAAFFGSLLVLGAVLFTTFENWHPWNQIPWFLRNRPLIWMENHWSFRLLAVAGLFLAIGGLWSLWRRQEDRPPAALLSIFTVLFLLPHPLVEVRYFLVPFVLAHLVTDLTGAQDRRLTLWYAALAFPLGFLIATSRTMW